MSKTDNKYMIITWWMDDMGDYKPTWEITTYFITGKELDDIKGLMRQHGIKRWVKDPETVTKETWKPGDASLIEYRNIEVRPMRIVESWAYSREKVNES